MHHGLGIGEGRNGEVVRDRITQSLNRPVVVGIFRVLEGNE